MFAKFILNRTIAKVKKSDQKRLATVPLEKGIKEFSQIAYLPDGNAMHTLDIYRPDTDKILPLIVDIHGGAWVYGTTEINKPLCYYLASCGFVVASINYRLATEVPLSQMLSDCFSAIDFLYNNGKNYGADIDNMFLAGDSAGGHLACLTVATNACEQWLDAYGLQPLKAQIKGVWSMCGVVTDKILSSNNFLVRYINQLLEGKPCKRNHILQRAYISQLPQGTVLPPLLLTDCQRDFTYNDQLMLKDEMDSRNMPCKTLLWDKNHKINHVFNVIDPYLPQSKQTNDQALQFFRSLCNN